MTTVDSPSDTRPDPLGVLVRDLQQLRLDAGAVSYGEIAQRIVARRMSEGASEAASRVARSTVYDAFQPGRRRLNPGLVREIVLALGLDAAQADEWHERCVLTRQPVPARTVAPAAPDAHPDDAAATPPAPLVPPQALRRALIAVLLVACLGLNLFGTTLVLRLEIPLFLDTIGTALAAFALGPWYGVAVGVATGLFGMVSSTPETVVFSAVSVVAALLWGYGLRRYARTPLRFLALAVTVAVACSVVAAPLNLALYGGASTNASSAFLPVTTSLGLIASVFAVNLGASLVDKVLTAFLALVAARWLAPLQLTGPPPALLRTPTPGGRVSA
ncbi:MAG: hypothetical protein ABS61_01020 [Microbacterium sp. SCN 70-18]|nr:hypothetical protein [Microbacterium chocolatum]ODT12062.1 MAG: hypothetical protein ABS61_01020 [Microbacterium sp. SCN 70-18]